MANNTKQLEVFTVWSDEIENRLDPFFYRPIFKKLVATINNAKRKAYSLGDIVEFSVAGDWGEDPNTFEPNPDYQLCYVLRNTNFDNKYNLNFDDVAQRYIKNGKVEKLALQKGEILIEKSGGSPVQPVGRVAFVEDLPFDKPVVFSNFLQKIRISGNSFLPEYVFTFLQAIYHLGYTEFLQNQTTGIKNLRLDDFLKIKIAELSKDEQKKIAKFAFDTRRKAKNMEEEAQQILASIDDFVLSELGIEIPEGGAERVYEIWSDEIFGGRLDPEYYNPRFKLFYSALSKAKYDIVNLEQITRAVFQGVGKNETENPAITLLKVKNITRNGDIDYSDTEFVQDVPETKLLQKGDIVSPFIGEAVRQCKFAIFDRDDAAFAVDNNTGVIRVDAEKANSRYVAEVLNSTVGKIQLEQLIGGGGVLFLGAANAAKLQIPLPSIKTQEKIAEKIVSFREQVQTLRAQAAEVLAGAQKQVEQMILN